MADQKGDRERQSQNPQRGSETGTQPERQQQGQPRRDEQQRETGNKPNQTETTRQDEQSNR